MWSDIVLFVILGVIKNKIYFYYILKGYQFLKVLRK